MQSQQINREKHFFFLLMYDGVEINDLHPTHITSFYNSLQKRANMQKKKYDGKKMCNEQKKNKNLYNPFTAASWARQMRVKMDANASLLLHIFKSIYTYSQQYKDMNERIANDFKCHSSRISWRARVREHENLVQCNIIVMIASLRGNISLESIFFFLSPLKKFLLLSSHATHVCVTWILFFFKNVNWSHEKKKEVRQLHTALITNLVFKSLGYVFK